jgi:hypothetical protein
MQITFHFAVDPSIEQRLFDQRRNHGDDVQLDLPALAVVFLMNHGVFAAKLELYWRLVDLGRLRKGKTDGSTPDGSFSLPAKDLRIHLVSSKKTENSLR